MRYWTVNPVGASGGDGGNVLHASLLSAPSVAPSDALTCQQYVRADSRPVATVAVDTVRPVAVLTFGWPCTAWYTL